MGDKFDHSSANKVYGRKLDNLLEIVKNTESNNQSKALFWPH